MTDATDAGEIDVIVAEPGWETALAVDPETLAASAAGAALQIHLGAGAVPFAKPLSGLAILLADDAAVADLNARFRDKPTPTNVLSWPAEARDAPAAPEAVLQPGHLGDVAVALGVTAREASTEGKPLEDHLRHLIVHGVLHLLGYDHEQDEDAALMAAQERAALAALGVADPYAGEMAAAMGAQGEAGEPRPLRSTSTADGNDGRSE